VFDSIFECRDIDSGKTISFVPEDIEPLGLDSLLGTRKNGNPGLPVVIRSTDSAIDGEKVDGRATVRTTIEFNEGPKPFVLVQGGWSPLALSSTRHFLVDRNVLSLLKQIQAGKSNARLDRFSWWWSMLDKESVSLNPLPAAMEGDKKQTPSYGEFVSASDTASDVLSRAVTKADVVRLGSEGLQAAYTEIQSLQARQSREAEVLQEICPKYLVDTISRDQRRGACEAILSALRAHKLSPFSFVGLCVMSALYRAPAGGDYVIGKELLKPTKAYDLAQAYNALSDIRHLEISAVASQLFIEPPALLTEDLAMAALWTVLRPRGTPSAHGCAIMLEVTPQLFTGLDAARAEQLVQLLRA